MAGSDFNQFNNSDLDKILYEIGWDYTFALPELNDANRALLEEVSVCPLRGVLESQVVLSYCLFDCIQTLLKANEKELEVTKHLKTLAEREQDRYSQLTAQANKEIKSSYEKMDRIENSQLKATQTLEELRLQMDLDQQTMENLLVEAAKKDDDLMVIMKYTQMDEHKIKSLFLNIEKKTLEVKEKRKALDKELTETRSAQSIFVFMYEKDSLSQSNSFLPSLLQMLEAQQHDLMEELFRQKQNFQSAKTKEKNLIALTSKNKFTITNLLSQLTKMENTLIRQQMISNNQEAKILMLQRKVAQLSGAIRTDESEMLEVKVNELTANLEDKKETAKILKNALSECEVLNNNLLKTEVKRIRDIIYKDADSMTSWEMRKLELEKAMKEREEEIHVYSEMLRHQLKITEQDRQKLSMELNEELSKVEMVKNRFEIMESSLAGSEGEKSQIYYITKASLDKEELRRKSEEMKAQIHRMELETEALKNTIQLFSGRCSDYSTSLSKVKKFSEEYQEKVQLEEELKSAENTLKFKKQQILDRLILYTFIKLTREIRSAQSTSSETLEEQDIKLRELKQFNKSINNMLNKAMQEDPDLRPILEECFQKVLTLFSMIQESSIIKFYCSSLLFLSGQSAASTSSLHTQQPGYAAYPSITSPTSPSSPSSSDSNSCKKTKKP
uniref:Coiled-coil domain-containing protein 39 n=1 Tax=Poecilia mexicana TaxID=48701 RepID=A0A3B3XM05_9TELE